jgi:hypothetical protein
MQPLLVPCERIAAEPYGHHRRNQSRDSDLLGFPNHSRQLGLREPPLRATYWLDHIGYFGPP